MFFLFYIYPQCHLLRKPMSVVKENKVKIKSMGKGNGEIGNLQKKPRSVGCENMETWEKYTL